MRRKARRRRRKSSYSLRSRNLNKSYYSLTLILLPPLRSSAINNRRLRYRWILSKCRTPRGDYGTARSAYWTPCGLWAIGYGRGGEETTLYNPIPSYTTLYHPTQPYTIPHHPTPPYTTLYNPTPSYTILHHPTQSYTTLYIKTGMPLQACLFFYVLQHI